MPLAVFKKKQLAVPLDILKHFRAVILANLTMYKLVNKILYYDQEVCCYEATLELAPLVGEFFVFSLVHLYSRIL